MNRSKLEALLAINIAAVVFGTTALYGKMDVAAVWIVAMRGLFSLPALALFAFARGELAVPPRTILKPLCISGLLLTLHWVSFFVAVQLAGVAVATVTFAAYPLFTLLLQVINRTRALRLLELGAATCIVLAVAMITNMPGGGNILFGALSGLASAALFAFFGISGQKASHACPTTVISIIQNGTVFCVLFPFLFFASPAPTQPQQWFWLFLLGLVATALMHQLYLFSLKRLSATVCSGFVALEPVYAIVLAGYLFGDRITPLVGVSAALIVAASLIFLLHDRHSAMKGAGQT
jgi:drug/metabolite transporter (DMT)-like permease